MDGIKYAVFTEKSLRLLGKNQYTSNVESVFTKIEIKHWVELIFGVKVVAVNSHQILFISNTPLLLVYLCYVIGMFTMLL